MSADNTIVILSTLSEWKKEDGCSKRVPKRRVYRVAEVSAWDNFEWYSDNQLYNLGFYLWVCFKHSAVYETEKEAFQRADELLKELGYVEYGVAYCETDYTFPMD